MNLDATMATGGWGGRGEEPCQDSVDA